MWLPGRHPDYLSVVAKAGRHVEHLKQQEPQQQSVVERRVDRRAGLGFGQSRRASAVVDDPFPRSQCPGHRRDLDRRRPRPPGWAAHHGAGRRRIHRVGMRAAVVVHAVGGGPGAAALAVVAALPAQLASHLRAARLDRQTRPENPGAGTSIGAYRRPHRRAGRAGGQRPVGQRLAKTSRGTGGGLARRPAHHPRYRAR